MAQRVQVVPLVQESQLARQGLHVLSDVSAQVAPVHVRVEVQAVPSQKYPDEQVVQVVDEEQTSQWAGHCWQVFEPVKK